MSILNGKQILVVEDEDDLRDILVDVLKSNGAEVLEASGGNEALKILDQHPLHAVISDVQMPNGSGEGLLDEIKKRNPFRPVVVMMSGYSKLTMEDAFRRGAEGFLTKPFRISNFIETIEELLDNAKSRWERKFERLRLQQPLGLKVSSLLSDPVHILNIGRGGMFIASNEKLPVIGSRFEFEISGPMLGKSKDTIVKGEAVCRWIRKEDVPGLPPGFGAEFMQIQADVRPIFEKYLNELKTIPYIPNS